MNLNSIQHQEHVCILYRVSENLVVFCQQKHKPQHCKIVRKIETRKSILRKKGRCFLCLRNGHVLRSCTQRFTCFKCESKHHISFCDEKKRTRDHSNKSIQKQSPSTAKLETQTDLNDPIVMWCFKQRLQMFICQTNLKVGLYVYFLIVVLSLVM